MQINVQLIFTNFYSVISKNGVICLYFNLHSRIAGLFNTEATFSNNSVEIRIDLELRLTHAGGI